MTLRRLYVIMMVVDAVLVGWVYGSVQWGLW